MRGFAGFFSFPELTPDAAGLLTRLGPPASDPWPAFVSDDARAGLTGPRLTRSADGKLTVLFDGTIYNRDALRAELTAAGASFPPTDHDGEWFLVLYAQRGSAAVERLRGPFALAVWDARTEEPGGAGGGSGLLARDASGLRTLCYSHDAATGRLVFATGVRPLAMVGPVPVRLDARGLYGFFRYGAAPEPLTLLSGVSALEAGGRLFWRAGHVTRDRFHVPPRFTASATAARASTNDERAASARSLRAALLDGVDRHLADGKTTGIFVGGGLGSAALLALARETGREKNLRALTLGFDDPAPDESVSARRLADHFGVPHTILRLDRALARAWFDDYLPALDQPAVRGFPLFALCRLARGEGIEAALAGIGAGELFGGGPSHGQILRLLAWSRRLGLLRLTLGRMLLAAARPPAARLLGDYLTRPPTPAGAYAAVRGIHSAGEARALVARFMDPTGCADPVPENLPPVTDFPVAAAEINALEFRHRLRDGLLRDATALGDAHGLELRLPFVDGPFVEQVASLPAAVRLEAGRQLLRRAVPEVPAWAGANASGGLPFPPAVWRVDEWAAAKPADASGLRNPPNWEQRWALFLFRRWRRTFNARSRASLP